MSTNYFQLNALARNAKVLVDTNFLIYNFYQLGGFSSQNQQKRIQKYSDLLNDIIKDQNSSNTKKFYLNNIILSEFINKALRISFSEAKKIDVSLEKTKFKNFLELNQGQKIKDDLLKIINIDMLSIFSIDNSTTDINKNLKYFSCKQLDYNDACIYYICKNNNYCLLTDDYDFHQTDLEILTRNYSYN